MFLLTYFNDSWDGLMLLLSGELSRDKNLWNKFYAVSKGFIVLVLIDWGLELEFIALVDYILAWL